MIPINAVPTLLKAGRVRRFHTVDTDARQTVGEHAYGVLAIFLAIYPSATLAGVAAVLAHDAAEVVVGDVPAPAKWGNERLDTALAEAETVFNARHGLDFDLSPEEAEHVKMADMLELRLYCASRMRNGDASLSLVYERITNAIVRSDLGRACDIAGPSSRGPLSLVYQQGHTYYAR